MLCAAAHRDARSDVSPGRPATDDASDELTRPHHACRRALTSFLRRNNSTRLRTDPRKQTGCLLDRVESRAFSLGRCKRAYEISESNSVGVILMLSRDGICQSAISIVTAGRHWSAPRGQVPHQIVSLLKRWLIGTHQGGVSRAHLDYYLDEFTFRFNRRTSRYQ